MTNLTPGLFRMILWATIVFLVVIILTKSFLYALIAESLYWCVCMVVRTIRDRLKP
jgi:hypothetical protein